MKACRVAYTSLMFTPCFRTFSLSTARNFCGVLGDVGGGHHSDFGTLVGGLEELIQIADQELGIAACAIFQHKLKSARSANARNRRR